MSNNSISWIYPSNSSNKFHKLQTPDKTFRILNELCHYKSYDIYVNYFVYGQVGSTGANIYSLPWAIKVLDPIKLIFKMCSVPGVSSGQY